MSPKTNKPDLSSEPDVTIDIPHEQAKDEPAPVTAPILPEEPASPPANVITTVSTEKTDQPVIPPPTIHEFHETAGRRWPVVIGYILAALLVAIAVVFLGRWIYHKTTHRSSTPPASNSNKIPATPSGTATPSSGNSATANPNSGTNSNSSTSQNQTSPSVAPRQLPNNGPGDVVAIFLGISLIFGGMHYLLSLRRSVS